MTEASAFLREGGEGGAKAPLSLSIAREGELPLQVDREART